MTILAAAAKNGTPQSGLLTVGVLLGLATSVVSLFSSVAGIGGKGAVSDKASSAAWVTARGRFLRSESWSPPQVAADDRSRQDAVDTRPGVQAPQEMP